jgi:hypothetical protein
MKWIRLRVSTLTNNHHGPHFTPLRRTWQIVRMGSYAKCWSLYVYRSDGRAIRFEVCFPRWLGEWPKSCDEWEPRRSEGGMT